MKTKYASQAARKFTKNAIVLAIIALALCASPGSRAAADCVYLAYWDNSGTGDWFNPLNWGPSHNQVPDCGTCCGYPWEVDINEGTAQINTGTAQACETFLGKDTAQQNGTLSVGGGTLNQCGDIYVGNYGKGTLNITNGGVVNTQFGAHIAAQAGSSGAVTVDNSQWTVTVDGAALNVGGTNTSAGGTGLLTVKNSGTASAASVHVYKSGTLTGNGTVSVNSGSGTATVEGTVSRSSGTLTITGNLSLTSTAATQISVTSQDNPNQADISVSAVAALNSRLLVTMTGNFTAGTRYTLLYAAGGRDPNHPTFSSVSINYPCECFNPRIAYEGDYVYLYLDTAACCTQ